MQQVALTIGSSCVGMISVFVIVEGANKAEYGIFVASFALQYVIARIIMGGILIELQKRLASAVNVGSYLPRDLLVWTVCLLLLTAGVLGALWVVDLILVPSLGILICLSMTSSISVFALKAWGWNRASVLGSELTLLGLLFHSRDELTLSALYEIYHIYYGVQFLCSGIGVWRERRHLRLSRSSTLALNDVVAGAISSLTMTVRDRLALAAAGYLFPPRAVADLAYLMTVLKGTLSAGGALNSVKFVYLAGRKNSINSSFIAGFLEALVLVAITLIGYAALWYYTIAFGNREYLEVINLNGVVAMAVSVFFIYSGSILYLNHVIRGELWVYNVGVLLFLPPLCFLLYFVHVGIISDAILFYCLLQILLFASTSCIGLMRSLRASNAASRQPPPP
jgi:hypothetical protein